MTTHKHYVLDFDSGDIKGIALPTETPSPNVIVALNESITGLTNEFGSCATPATIIVDNIGEIITT